MSHAPWWCEALALAGRVAGSFLWHRLMRRSPRRSYRRGAALPWEAEPAAGEAVADYDLERLECRRHARLLGMGFADLSRFEPPDEAFARLPAWACRRHRVVPLGEAGGVLYLAVADPADADALRVASRCASGGSGAGAVPVRFVLATPRDIDQALWRQFEAKPRQEAAAVRCTREGAAPDGDAPANTRLR